MGWGVGVQRRGCEKRGVALKHKSHQRIFSPFSPTDHWPLLVVGQNEDSNLLDGLSQVQGSREGSISPNTCSYRGTGALEGKEDLDRVIQSMMVFFVLRSHLEHHQVLESRHWSFFFFFNFLVPQHRNWRAEIHSYSSFRSFGKNLCFSREISTSISKQPLAILTVYWKFRKLKLSTCCTEAGLVAPRLLLPT